MQLPNEVWRQERSARRLIYAKEFKFEKIFIRRRDQGRATYVNVQQNSAYARYRLLNEPWLSMPQGRFHYLGIYQLYPTLLDP